MLPALYAVRYPAKADPMGITYQCPECLKYINQPERHKCASKAARYGQKG